MRSIKNLFQFCLLGLFSCISFFLNAQDEATSLLWEISGKGLEKPSYLYGTIHIQDKKVFQFPDVVTTSLFNCDAYAMEVLLDEVDPATVQAAMLMKDKTLKDLFSEEEFKILDRALKEKIGQSALLFNMVKPFFISAQLMQSDLKQDMPLALDMHLLKMAKDSGLIGLGIEKFQAQVDAINSISLEDQAKMLMESTIDTISDDSTKMIELLDGYLAGDITSLIELMKDTTMPEEFNKEFIVKRNRVMAKNIIKFSKTQPTFNAIGAAHLGGDEGVISLIRSKGYVVKAIPFKFK